MRLLSFSVENYRSIAKTELLYFRSAMTALVGPNNEGKSNILRSLVLSLRALGGLARYAAAFEPGDTRHVFRSRSLLMPEQPQESEFTYDWERDFPLSMQVRESGRSTMRLEFHLEAKEFAQLPKGARPRAGSLIRITVGFGANDIAVDAHAVHTVGKRTSVKPISLLVGCLIGRKFECQYIPSVRTAQSAADIVQDLVARELTALEKDSAFQRALNQVEKIQRPVLRQISKSVTLTLREFLPSVKTVKVDISTESRYRALRRSCTIVVDDGANTHLRHKGDGVQSLAALSLMRYSSLLNAGGKQILLAVEEPETHLHPSAIHQLKAVLQEIAGHHQVILTTHNPLFVARDHIASNIVVSGNTAAPAQSMQIIRDVLGVRPTDNLQRAELVLIVEGEDDRIALSALLGEADRELADALASESLVIDTLLGSSKLSFKLDQLRSSICPFHCFLDHDEAGRLAASRAEADGLLKPADVHHCICRGMVNSELEDLFAPAAYAQQLASEFGVRLNVPEFRGNRKWSERVREVFVSQGKQWTDGTKAKLKLLVAKAIAQSPRNALIPQKRTALDALVATLKSKLAALQQGGQQRS